ncbi:MAG: FtsQ-type POTRA domain-containing protein [Clostridia bacterium]|nr:FtsQ-type POTRA domain-containing protein [Clostridia bacterium]
MISLIFSGSLFVLNKIFSVKSIECNETEMYSCSEIMNASGIKIGDKILFLNNALAEIKIYDKFPYIDSVKVDVQFPNKVKISVDKAEPTFSFNLEEGKYAVISKKNKFIETRSEKSDDLTDVVGAKFSINKCTVNYEDKSVPILLEKLNNGFKSNGLSLKEIDITDINNIIVNYDNRINIELGNDSDIDYKITTAKEIILKNSPDSG